MAKILIADDDPDILELLKFTLETENHQVLLATNGEDAFKKISAEMPDAVVLDVMMPKMTGYEVCEKIREHPALASTLVIMLTAKGQTKDKITGIKLGADDYMAKPFEPHELSARIEGLLLRRARQSPPHGPAGSSAAGKSLEETLKDCLNKGSQFTLGALDINGFKQFNEKFGHKQGDKFLEEWKRLLEKLLAEQPSSSLFAQGGDDFVFLLASDSSDAFSRTLLQEFEKLAMAHSPASPLSLAIGLLQVNPAQFSHHSQILDRLKEFLKLAKSQPGSHVIKGA